MSVEWSGMGRTWAGRSRGGRGDSYSQAPDGNIGESCSAGAERMGREWARGTAAKPRWAGREDQTEKSALNSVGRDWRSLSREWREDRYPWWWFWRWCIGSYGEAVTEKKPGRPIRMLLQVSRDGGEMTGHLCSMVVRRRMWTTSWEWGHKGRRKERLRWNLAEQLNFKEWKKTRWPVKVAKKLLRN